ncbi:hypothetical protein N7520_009876 [Penicillium odoratum]|uniref:uncharacterized protein n=1 Tax=Penicillium odoratum TaxID=1167516 RepID=UPI0025485B21|nr:uncharacterized protein N7520_009876 [Penicillium odoratum]KAJ5752959.1 hypothetical protein N7520_009876 [Penicillium odoratum]
MLAPHRHRGRGMLAILRSYLGKRHNPETRQDATFQDAEINMNDTEDNDHDTHLIVNQLAALATTVSQATNSPSSIQSSSTQKPPSGREDKDKDQDQDQEESFHYLRSLITISEPTSTQTLHVPTLRRKRASSRLSLRLDIPLPFIPNAVHKPNPSPRYTTLPPAYTYRPSIRPEVRF